MDRIRNFRAFFLVHRLDIAINFIFIGVLAILIMLSAQVNQNNQRSEDTQQLIICGFEYFDRRGDLDGIAHYLEECREEL